MRRRSLVLALAASSLLAVPALVGGASADRPELAPGTHPGASNGVVYHYARGQAPARSGGSNRVLMTNHGGPIMTTTHTHVIYWGPKWGNATFAGDKVAGLTSWYQGFGGSKYASASTEYTSGSTQVTSASTYVDSQSDPSAASGGQNTGAILSEVAKLYPNPEPDGYFAVYTDLRRGNAGYCAWHSSGAVNNKTYRFAFFWDLDGDPGCDPGDTSGQHSQGLAALANVTGHELSEAITDPSLNAWFDASGAENGDKCAWTFGAPLVPFSNGTQWKIQGEWSNNAYNKVAGYTGYPNGSGQVGCLSGA